jgi:hypothetical protein
MKPMILLLCFMMCLPSLAQVKDRDWKPATVADIAYSDDEIVKPHSHMVKRPGCQGGLGCYDRVQDEPIHIPTTVILYRLETADMIYSVRQIIHKNGKPLNITLHGQTKIAVEEMNAYILDDDGKDVKLPIVQKAAKLPA